MPNGVTFCFQVCLYSIEPTEANRSLNLLAIHAVRAADADEPHERGPEMTRIGLAFLGAGGGEGLTGAASGPASGSGVDSGEAKGFEPSGDSAEEMTLGIFVEVIGIEFGD
jgi:hypothetical protein